MNIVPLSYHVIAQVGPVDHLKLQKLLYYLKVWGIVSGAPLIEEGFEKWQFGPVNPEVWKTFTKFGNTPIPQAQTAAIGSPTSDKALFDFILDCYAPFDGITLSSMTHQDLPWKEGALNQVIPDSVILKYYASLPFAKNFPVEAAKPFYPVESDFHYAFIFDMDKESASSLVFPSYGHYKSLVSQNKEFLGKALSKIGNSK
jgi:uncharacterized phage-associated protein